MVYNVEQPQKDCSKEGSPVWVSNFLLVFPSKVSTEVRYYYLDVKNCKSHIFWKLVDLTKLNNCEEWRWKSDTKKNKLAGKLEYYKLYLQNQNLTWLIIFNIKTCIKEKQRSSLFICSGHCYYYKLETNLFALDEEELPAFSE